jgi:glycosyltransferase involved in cell wall biosynthesis
LDPKIDLRVCFYTDFGVDSHVDPGFGTRFCWDVPLLNGYKYHVLKNVSPVPGVGTLYGAINPGVVTTVNKMVDAVWVHGWSALTSWMAFATALGLHVPIMLRGETNSLMAPGGVRGACKKMALGTLFKYVAAFLAIGSSNAEFYRSYGVPKEKIFLTPYSVDNDLFNRQNTPVAHKQESRRTEGIAGDLPCVLFVGKLVEYKRPQDLLAAFEIMSGHLPASLVFVGDGPLRPTLELYVRERRLRHVHFLGFRNQRELAGCYSLADLFVLPSVAEQWGLVVNEAMCARLPVLVSTMVGAAADLVREGDNGATFVAGDVSALAASLTELLADRANLVRMGQRSGDIIATWSVKETAEGVRKALDAIRVKKLYSGSRPRLQQVVAQRKDASYVD